MLEGISQIKDKVHPSKYEEGGKRYDVDAIVAELKKDEKFKKFSEGELYEYAYGLIANHNAHAIKGALQSMGFNTGKPQDPFWSQYTYEEILNMVNDGVLVPQEFIDWAYTMQDSDTTAYQIEDSSEDSNTYENLSGETGNIDQSDIQKRAQAFASKAQSQEQLINNKVEETKPLLNSVQAEKNDLEKSQKSALEKVDSMTNEWKSLDRKFKNGDELTDAEQKRYKELGLLLNDRNNNLILQTKKVSSDIEELMNQIENIDMLLDINEKINAEIEDVGTRMSWFEGNKKHIILPASSGNQVTGLSAAFYTAAMGNNLAFDTGLTGINLFFSNMEVENQQGLNLSIANQTQEQVNTANNTAKKRDDNLVYTTNKQAENRGDDKKAEDKDNKQNPQNNINNPDKEKTDGLQTVQKALLPEENQQSETQKPVDSETGNITGFAAVVNESSRGEVKTNTQLQSKVSENINNAAVVTTPESNANTSAVDSAQTTEAAESAETTEASSASATTETAENTQSSVETEDPLKAETSQYVSECASRNNAMAQAEQQIQAKIEEVKNIKNNQKQEDAKINNELSKSISEYEKLAQKVKNGESLTEGEQKRVKTLEKAINATNGTLITAMKDKVTALTGFSSELRNDIQTTIDNQEYGEQAVAKGKEYAKATLGDKSYLYNIFFWFAFLSKEEQYDILYGKSGESLGRDAIDNGELLVDNAVASNQRLSKSLPLAGFAMNYAQELNTKISETNKKVSSIKNDLSNSVQGNSAPTDKASQTDNSTKSKEKEDLDQNDAQDIKTRGNKIKQEGKETKREGDEAKREKTKTDKDSKKEVNNLKKTAANIAKLNAENKELNLSIEAMNNEAEILNSEVEAASAQQSTAEPQNTQSVGFNNNANTGAMTLNSSSNQSVPDVSPKIERLQAIATQSEYSSNKININNKSITVMNKNSSKRVKQLQKTSQKRHKYYENRSRKAEETEQENSKFQEKVNSSAKIFTGIMATGLALMVIPWTHAIGEFMFHTGAYGTSACYLTNSAIYAANGNLKAALINFGAAGLSFLGAGAAAATAMGAVSQIAAQAGTKAAVTAAVTFAAVEAGAVALQKAADKPFQNSDENIKENKKGRRLVSYQEKRSRQSKMDKIDHTKKVVMSRGQKKR